MHPWLRSGGGLLRRVLRFGTVGRSVRLAYSPSYVSTVPSAMLDPQRAERILAHLIAQRWIAPDDVHRPDAASLRTLRTVHSDDYLESLQRSGAMAQVLGFELDPPQQDDFVTCHRFMVGGTLLATKLAVESSGIAMNLGAGFHHAHADRGHGFCVFNDVALAVARLRATGFDRPVLVVDLDLHDGDGTRSIFAHDPGVHTFSIHNRDLGPTDVEASTSLALGDGIRDDRYLDVVRSSLPPIVRSVRPGVVFYVAGCDPAEEDPLGNWKISADGLLQRDLFVLDQLAGFDPDVPRVILLAGGYGQRSWRHTARFLGRLIAGPTAVEPPRTIELTVQRHRRVARLLRSAQLTSDPTTAGSDFTDSDVDPAQVRGSGSGRFLGYYSTHGIELALERYGVLDRLRAEGFKTVRLDFDLGGAHAQTLRILTDSDPPESLIELRARRDLRTVRGMELLAVEWLLIQNPRARFRPDQSRLPGQRHPGLGLLSDASAMLMLICERLELGGIMYVPAHYHLAALTESHFKFLEPREEARFRKLREVLRPFRLHEASRKVEEGAVLDCNLGVPVCWSPSPAVLPVSRGLADRLCGEPYESRVSEELSRLDFLLGPKN